MKERPILFSTEMVRAILDGHKTMTRRVIKPQPLSSYGDESDAIKLLKSIPKTTIRIQDAVEHDFTHVIPKCPYGQVGDRLWLKETWAIGGYTRPKDAFVIYKAGELKDHKDIAWNDWLEQHTKYAGSNVADKWRSGRFMFKWASRITLEITEIRVQRLQGITRDDAIAEGVANHKYVPAEWTFETVWQNINGKKHPWASNPFVWAISFKRVK